MFANIDMHRIRCSTPTELRDYYSQALHNAPVGEITTQLLQAVERGSVSPLAFAPWLGVAKSPSAIREALIQDTSVLIRKLATKQLRKALCSPRWWETWEGIGGTAGLLDIFADLSVLEIRSACAAIGRCGRGTNLAEKRELFTDLFKALHPEQFPDMPHKTKDRRALGHFYQLLIPACSRDLVEEAIAKGLDGTWTEMWGKHLVKYHPEYLQEELLRLLSAEQLSTIDTDMFQILLHHHPPATSTTRGFSKSMDFSLKVLQTLSNSARRIVEDDIFIDQLVNPLLKRAIKRHVDWDTIRQIVNLTMQYLETHPSTGCHVTAFQGDFLQQVAFCWSQQPSLFEQQLRKLCAHPVFGRSNMTNIRDWDGVLAGIPAKQSYSLLRLCYQEATSLDLDSDSDLEKVKGSMHQGFFRNMSPRDALLLFTRLRRVKGDVDLIDADGNFSIFTPTSTFGGFSGDPNLIHIFLLSLNNKEEEAMAMASSYVDTRKRKAATASQPEQRAFFAKSALLGSIATGSLQMFKNTSEWTKRFLRDPLVIREIYPQSYPEEATRLLSGIPESIKGTLSLAELHQRVSAANKILQGMFDTVCESLREPSFCVRDWEGVFDLFYEVVSLRISLTPRVKKQLNASDQEIMACLWTDTIDMIISVEEKAQKEGHERLEANLFRGIIAYNRSFTIDLESRDVSTYAFFDSLARARDELWCRLRPLTHPATVALPEPFPRGLPLQYLTAPWALNVKNLSSVAPYIASRTERTLFPDPKTALRPAPPDRESQKAIGVFVDDYQYALQLYIPRACDRVERETRVEKAWAYAIGPLSSNRMTEDEAIRFWRDKKPLLLSEWPPKDITKTIEKPWPLIPEPDGSTEPCEWNPFLSRPDFAERDLGEPTYVDFSVGISENASSRPPIDIPVVSSATVPAYEEEAWRIWTSTRDMGEGGVLSALLYLDAKHESNDRLIATPFPSASDMRYPSLYLDDDFLTSEEPNQFTAAGDIRGHLDTIPPTLLAQLSRNIVKALDNADADADAQLETRDHIGLHSVAMQLMLRVGESDRPSLAVRTVVRTILDQPKSSSYHRQLLKPSFLRRLPAGQARSCIEAVADGLIRMLQAKDDGKENSDDREVASKDESYAKVTTVKMLAQLFQDLNITGTDYALSVLSTLSKLETHVDVQLNVVKSLLVLFESGSREQSRQALTLIESFVPLAGALDERQPLDEARWSQCEQHLSLPELQPGISGMASSESPILVALTAYMCQEKTATSQISSFVSQIMMPVLQSLRDQTARWAALFVRKYGLGDELLGNELLGNVRIPPIPRDPSVNRSLLSVKKGKLHHIPCAILEEYVAYMSFRVALPAPVQAMNERLDAHPALRSLPEVQTWMRLYGRTREVTGDVFFDVLELLEHVVDSSDDVAITPTVVQEEFLKLFTVLLWNDTPAYTNLTRGLCSRLLDGQYLDKTWWIPYGKPVLEAMVSYVNTLRTRDWERDPARRPSVLPDTFPWRLQLLEYPWPLRDEGKAVREQKCKGLAGQLIGLIDEMASLPVYHKHFDQLSTYLATDIVSSEGSQLGEKRFGTGSVFYDKHDLLHDALMGNRILTATYVGDMRKTRLIRLTTSELLRVDVAATLIELVGAELGEEEAILDNEIRVQLRALIETWKACDNEGVRRRAWEIEQEYLK